MDISFLGHSGFLVRLASVSLLFDWSEGELPALEPEVPQLVFASHGHEDHFQPAIFCQPAQAWLLGRDIHLSPRIGSGGASVRRSGPGACPWGEGGRWSLCPASGWSP